MEELYPWVESEVTNYNNNNTNVRILMMAGIYDLSGVSTVIENLASNLGKKGLDVTIGALKFKRIPPKGKYDVVTIPLFNVLKLRKFLNSFDILHSHHPLTNYLAFFSHKPFVYHYHGAPDFKKRHLSRLHMLLSINIMKHAFDAIISISESGAKELKRYFGINDVDIIYNGVDTNHFKPNLDERFRKGTPQLLFVGNLYEHKKVDELILALKELVKTYPEAYLQIVGNGHMYECLKRFIAKLKLEEHVELVGRVPDRELPYYYASCNLYVTASRWELFGLPLLEAMACGKPIVASSIPPHVDLLTKSKAGMAYNTGDITDLCTKIIKVYEEKGNSNNALLFSKEHSWSAIADKVLDVYFHLLNR